MTFLTRAMSQEIFNKIMTDFIECDKLLSALSYIGVTELEQLLTLPNDILDGLTMPFTDDNVDSYIPYFNKKKVKLVFCWLNKKWSNNLVPPTYEEWMALTLDDFNEFQMNTYNMFVFTKDFMTNGCAGKSNFCFKKSFFPVSLGFCKCHGKNVLLNNMHFVFIALDSVCKAKAK